MTLLIDQPSPAPLVTVPAPAPSRRRGRRVRCPAMVALLGPAFIASVAYIDPGNFATNFQAGGVFGYSLLWVVGAANATAMLVQYLAAKVGVATGRSLPGLCRSELPRRMVTVLWWQAEAVAMATDAAEFVGCALGLNLLFGIPLPVAAVVTAFVAYGILAMEHRGRRRYEKVITALIAVVGLVIVYDVLRIGPSSPMALHGLLPRLPGHGGLMVAVAIVGATIMPHAIYLHSSLTTGGTGGSRGTRLRASSYDTFIALGVAGLVNMAMLVGAARLLHHPGGPARALSLPAIHQQMAQRLGGGAALAFAVALLASGAASSSVGTHAGQAIMAGFTRRTVPLWVRRTLTMLPSMIILTVGVAPTTVLVWSQLVLSFGIPFALVPLVAVTSSRRLMGALVNRRQTTVAAVAVAVTVIGLNATLLLQAL